LAEKVLTDNGPGWVKMYHPTSENATGTDAPPTAEVPIAAFREVWEPKGWELVPGQDVVDLNVDPDTLTKKGDLVALAEARGVDSSGTADEIRDRLTGRGV
jgi:hypothetical protein